MTRDEIIAFHDSVESFAVLSDRDAERVAALSGEDRRALYDYIKSEARTEGGEVIGVEEMMRRIRARAERENEARSPTAV